MTVVSINTKEPVEQGNISNAVPFSHSSQQQQDLPFVVALVEATKECKLAALRISELSKQAIDTLLQE